MSNEKDCETDIKCSINLATAVFLSDALVKLGTNSFKIFTITAASISGRLHRKSRHPSHAHQSLKHLDP